MSQRKVKAGQTSTHTLRCMDPACVIDPASGKQHAFEKVEDGDCDASEQEEEEEYVTPADRIEVPLDVQPTPELQWISFTSLSLAA